MVPQTKCCYSFLFSKFLTGGSVTVAVFGNCYTCSGCITELCLCYICLRLNRVSGFVSINCRLLLSKFQKCAYCPWGHGITYSPIDIMLSLSGVACDHESLSVMFCGRLSQSVSRSGPSVCFEPSPCSFVIYKIRTKNRACKHACVMPWATADSVLGKGQCM